MIKKSKPKPQKSSKAKKPPTNTTMSEDPLKKLKETYLSNCLHHNTQLLFPQPAFLKRIEKSISSGERIDKIILNTPVSYMDIYAISTTFAGDAGINTVGVCGSRVCWRGIDAFMILTKSTPTITQLHLIDCKINESMCSNLSTLLSNSNIKNLCLDHNTGMGSGINQIMETVRKVGVLKFSARYCDIGDNCAESLKDLFDEESLITDIDLTGNYLSDSTLGIISKPFRMNNNLKFFSIASNGINLHCITSIIPEVQTELVKDKFIGIGDFIWTCHDNTGLTLLDLRGNHFGEDVGKQVEEMLIKRKSLAKPIVCLVTERISEGLFNSISDLNESMVGGGAKKAGGKKKKGKK